MSFLRKHRYALVAAAFALAAGGCGGTTGSGAGETSAASIVPASAPAFVAVDTDMDSAQWHALDRLANAFPDKGLLLDRLRGELRKNGLDWRKDVQPGLGPEIDLAVLDFSPAANIVGLLKPGDRDAFERLVQKSNANDPSSKLYARTIDGW